MVTVLIGKETVPDAGVTNHYLRYTWKKKLVLLGLVVLTTVLMLYAISAGSADLSPAAGVTGLTRSNREAFSDYPLVNSLAKGAGSHGGRDGIGSCRDGHVKHSKKSLSFSEYTWHCSRRSLWGGGSHYRLGGR